MNVFVLIIAPAMQPIYSLLFLTWFIVLWSAGSPILHATPGCSRQPGPAHKHRILGLGEIDLYLNRLPCFVHTYHSEPSDWIDQRAQLLTLHLVTHTLPAACLKKVFVRLLRIQLPGPIELCVWCDQSCRRWEVSLEEHVTSESPLLWPTLETPPNKGKYLIQYVCFKKAVYCTHINNVMPILDPNQYAVCNTSMYFSVQTVQ